MNYWEASEKIGDLRASLLTDEDGDDATEALPPMAEQHYMLALAALETAQRQMKLVDYCNMRAF